MSHARRQGRRRRVGGQGLHVRKANDLSPNVLCTVMAMKIAAVLPALVRARFIVPAAPVIG